MRGAVVLDVNGIRMELKPDDTGDTDVSLGIGADATRGFLQDAAARIKP